MHCAFWEPAGQAYKTVSTVVNHSPTWSFPFCLYTANWGAQDWAPPSAQLSPWALSLPTSSPDAGIQAPSQEGGGHCNEIFKNKEEKVRKGYFRAHLAIGRAQLVLHNKKRPENTLE